MLAALLLIIGRPPGFTILERMDHAPGSCFRKVMAPLSTRRVLSPSGGCVGVWELGVGSSVREHGQEPQRILSLEELATSSSIAGVAEVVHLTVRRDPETGGIYTDAHLTFRESWSPACPAHLLLTQLGGELDGRRSAIAGGNWTLARGETIVLFAKPWKGLYAAVTGMRQGLGHVDAQGRITWDLERKREADRPTLEELRTRVSQALGRTLTAPGSSPSTPPAPSIPAPPASGAPAPPPRSAERQDPGSGGLPFFLLAGLLALAALALRLRRQDVTK